MTNSWFDFNVRPGKAGSQRPRGFIVTPTADNGDVWGKPFTDQFGSPIFPGTLNGPDSKATLSVKAGSWAFRRDPQRQNVGNIDWKGPWIDEKRTKRKVVSVNGPTSRYWNDGSFVYGSDQSHRYVYSDGKVIGITPEPVLGASIATFIETIDGELTEVEWIIVVCSGFGADIAYAKKGTLTLNSNDITPEEVVQYSSKYSNKNPTGWVELGRTSGYIDQFTPVAPESPWFFSEDGLSARTMRRHTITHSDNGASLDDQLYREIRMTVDPSTKLVFFGLPDTAGFINTGESKIRWKTTTTSTREQWTYVQPALGSSDGFSHTFREDLVTATQRMVGNSKVAVDYDPDRGEWLYGWIEGSYIYGFEQYFTIGIDDPGHPGTPNTGNTNGPQPVPVPYIPSKGDHYARQWLGFNSSMRFLIGTNSLQPSGEYADLALHSTDSRSSSTLTGIPPESASDLVFRYLQSFHSNIQYMDIRSGLMCAFSETLIAEIEGGGFQKTEGTLQWAGVLDTSDYPTEPDSDHRVFSSTQTDLENVSYYGSWNRTYLDSLPLSLNQSQDHYSYSAEITQFNSDGSEWVPYWQELMPSWMANSKHPYLLPSSITEVLTGTNSAIDGVFGTTEKQESLVAIRYLDVTERSIVSRSHSWNVSGDPLQVIDSGSHLGKGGLF